MRHGTGLNKRGENIPDDKDSRVLRELVLLSVRLKVDLAPDSVTEVDLTIDHVREGGRG